MVRRRYVEQPVSRLAIWSRRCAVFSLAATALAVIVMRADLFEAQPALAALAGALALAIVAILLALGAFAVIWQQGAAGAGSAFLGLALGVALLAYPAYLGARAWQLPPISDVTTDPFDPPRFEVLAPLRPQGRGQHPGRAVIEQQKRAYPGVDPIMTAAAPQTAHRIALAEIKRLRWQVMADRPPQPPDDAQGHIEAVARGLLLGLRSDVVVRVRPVADGSRIDLRSASRLAIPDLGGNAAQVEALSAAIAEALARAPIEPPPEVPEATKKQTKTK